MIRQTNKNKFAILAKIYPCQEAQHVCLVGFQPFNQIHLFFLQKLKERIKMMSL